MTANWGQLCLQESERGCPPRRALSNGGMSGWDDANCMEAPRRARIGKELMNTTSRLTLVAWLLATTGCAVQTTPAARPLDLSVTEDTTHSAVGSRSAATHSASGGSLSAGPATGSFALQAQPAEVGGYELVAGPIYRLPSRYDESWAQFVAVAIGDVDGDRRDDLVARSHDNTVHILRQQPDGTLGEAEKFTFGVRNYATMGDDLLLADLNGDGVRDVVYSASEDVGEYSQPRQGMMGVAAWRRGRGWENRLHMLNDDGYGVGSRLVSIDVDLDGHLDLVGGTAVMVEVDVYTNTWAWECGVDKHYCARYRIAYGDGTGGFSRVETVKLGLPYQFVNIASTDLNGDGRSDLALTMLETETGIRHVLAMHQSGYGTLLPPFPLYQDTGLGSTPYEVFGDVSGDGIPDVVAFIQVRTMSLAGTFSQPTYLPFWGNGHAPATVLADLDGDRRLDLVNQQLRPIDGSPYSTPILAIYLQKNGAMVPSLSVVETTHHFSNHRNALAAGDLNGDGCGDVAVAGSTDGLAIFYGTGCTPYVPPLPIEPGPRYRVP